MSTESVTIKDIAKLLGISKSTVSRALSEHSDVNQETRKKVLEVAHKLNYQPNALAINLKQQRTHTIGVIIPETVNHFFVKAIGGIQRVANLAGYNVMTCQSDESYITERNNLQTLVTSRVDGMLISISTGTQKTDHFNVLMERNIPVVFFDRTCEELRTSQVYTNNYEIAFEGTEHLIAQGCRKIAIVAGPQNLNNSRNRLQGYIDALKKHELPIKESYIIHSYFSGGNIQEYTRGLINQGQRPDAVFAINDYAAIEMMHVMKKNGLSIPKDIAVLGFNNENICPFVDPSLSSIDHPAYDIGTAAAEILLHMIKTGDHEPQRRIIKSRLVMRESTHLRSAS
jgi:DNA-binding LacI/PurR family transcriptional regulator